MPQEPDNEEQLKEAVDGLTSALSEALTLAKTTEEENKELRTKIAQQDKVILEKVASIEKLEAEQKEASSKPVQHVSVSKVASLTAQMCEVGILTPEAAQELSAKLVEHPDNIVKLASNILGIHEPAHEQGRGISTATKTKGQSKSASADEAERAAWQKVLEEGA